LDSIRRDDRYGAAASRTDHELWRQDGVGCDRRCTADGTDKAGRLGQSGRYCLTNRGQGGRRPLLRRARCHGCRAAAGGGNGTM